MFCNNTAALFDLIADQHGRQIRAVHHGVDAGKGFVKFDLTMEFETKADNSDISDQSRRRVIIIAIAPEVAESNSVFGEIYKLLALPVYQHFHSFHADLKAIAYGTGIDGGSSSHPCPYCYIEITIRRSLKQQFVCGTLRTCASNRRYYKKFLKSSDKTAAADHFNCTSDPLLLFPQKSPVISWCRLPQLHLHLHLDWYFAKMRALHPQVVDWYRHFHQTPSDFHGGAFQGPQLQRLTRNDSMLYLKQLLNKTEASPHVILYFNAMEAFVALKKRCFSITLADGGYKQELKEYKNACLLLPV